METLKTKKDNPLTFRQVLFPTALSLIIFLVLIFEYLRVKEFSQSEGLIELILGTLLLLIMTVYMLVLKKELLAKAAGAYTHAPLKNIETFTKKSSMGHMSESMVHEINNPLEIINQNAGLLKDILNMSGENVGTIHEMPLREKIMTLTNGILEGVSRSRHVMERFLRFAQNIDNEKLDVDINVELDEIIGLCREEALYQDIRIELNKGRNIPHITKGSGLIQHIFFNILSFIINDVRKDTSIIISSEQIDASYIKVTFNYRKIMSNTNRRREILSLNTRILDVLKQDDIRLIVSREFIEKINGRMDVTAQDESDGYGVSIILIIPV